MVCRYSNSVFSGKLAGVTFSLEAQINRMINGHSQRIAPMMDQGSGAKIRSLHAKALPVVDPFTILFSVLLLMLLLLLFSSSLSAASSQARSCTVGIWLLATGWMAKISMACTVAACSSSPGAGTTRVACLILATMVMVQMVKGSRETIAGRANEGEDQVVMSRDPAKNAVVSLEMESVESRATNNPNWTRWAMLLF